MKYKKLFLRLTLMLACLTVTNISAFAHDFAVNGVYYNKIGNEAIVTFRGAAYSSYNEYTGDVAIPATVSYEGTTYAVTAIGDGAFRSCSNLTSVSLPNSIISIGNSAFRSSKISSITIPNSVTTIGDYVFSWCSSLTNVKLGNSVESLGRYAFSWCSALPSLTIPRTVNSIDISITYKCTALTSITVENGNSVYDSRENCNAVIETATNTIVVGCISTTIPTSVTAIGGYAYEGCSEMTSIVIPDNVTSIGMYAFRHCSGLTDVQFPNTLTNIGENAFRECTGLTSLILPNALTAISDYAFYGCTGLTAITCNATTPPAMGGNNVFSDYETPTLYVAMGAVEAYQTTDVWKNFTKIVGLGEEGNCLSICDTTAYHGDTIVIPIAMSNTSDISAVQTDIFLPDGLELLKEDGEYIIEPSSRLTGTHTLMSNNVSNGGIRLLCFSSNGSPLNGNDGDLFYLIVKVANNADGDYTIALRNTVLTTTEAVDLHIPDITANVNVYTYILGDANDSRTVTVTDIVTTAKYILEMNPQPFVFAAADVNADQIITASDIVLISRMVLNGQMLNVPLKLSAHDMTTDRFYIEDFTIAAGETKQLSIMLDNDKQYTAFQTDLYLPEGLEAEQEDGEYIFDLTSRKGLDHILTTQQREDGAIRLLSYSLSVKSYSGNSGALVTFNVKASNDFTGPVTIALRNTLFTETETTAEVAFADEVCTATASGEAEVLPGDANGDGIVNIIDVTNLIDKLLSGPVSVDENPSCDVNCDGLVNITDVTALIDILLNGN